MTGQAAGADQQGRPGKQVRGAHHAFQVLIALGVEDHGPHALPLQAAQLFGKVRGRAAGHQGDRDGRQATGCQRLHHAAAEMSAVVRDAVHLHDPADGLAPGGRKRRRHQCDRALAQRRQSSGDLDARIAAQQGVNLLEHPAPQLQRAPHAVGHCGRRVAVGQVAAFGVDGQDLRVRPRPGEVQDHGA